MFGLESSSNRVYTGLAGQMLSVDGFLFLTPQINLVPVGQWLHSPLWVSGKTHEASANTLIKYVDALASIAHNLSLWISSNIRSIIHEQY